MRAVVAGLVASVACGGATPRATPVSNPGEGVAIAVYARGDVQYGVVDDRRWVELEGGALTLDRIDPEAPLPSLAIEALGGSLELGTCTRERIDPTPAALDRLAALPSKPTWDVDSKPTTPTPAGVLSPIVRCQARGATGRQLVRVLYVAPLFRYRTTHELDVTEAGAARVATRFLVATPAWNVRAEVTLYDGVPGDPKPPRELARGAVKLEGGTALLDLPARTIPARLRTVFDAAVVEPDAAATDPSWGRDSRTAVWTTLELDDPTLPAGSARVRVPHAGTVRDVAVAAADRQRVGTTLRYPLWVEPQLRGLRRHWFDRFDDQRISERVELSVSNAGDVPREVDIEERLRPLRDRTILPASPTKPTIVAPFARTRVTVPPGGNARVGFTVIYKL